MNMMRSMLKGAGVPKNLRAEAITAACYIKNRFISSSKSTPHELWFGTKPDVFLWTLNLQVYCIFARSQRKEKLWMIDLKNASSLNMELEIFTGS